MEMLRNFYQRNSSWNAPYTFSGKEKDAETGYGYFGARYYDSGLSIWLSVDPMSDKYPSMSPYNYCANNPVMLTDPDGRWIPGLDDDGNTTYTAEKGDNLYTFQKQFGVGKKEALGIFNQSKISIDDNASFEKGQHVIKGDVVKKHTGSDVLKGQWGNLTNTQKASQIMFAIMHSNNTGNYDDYGRVNLNDYIDNFSVSSGLTFLENVEIPVKGGGMMKVITMTIPYAVMQNPPYVLRFGQPIKGPYDDGLCFQAFSTGKNLKTGHKTEAFTLKFNKKYLEDYEKSYYK